MEYMVDQEWFGWWGGFGRSADVEDWLDGMAAYEGRDGWKIKSISVATRWWMWLIPRPKLLVVLERERSHGD